MVSKIGPKDFDVTIKFGGGLHTRASEDEIDPREAADGFNFLLDIGNRELRPRPAFDLVGQVPNGAEIRGGFSLLKSDGTVSTCFQAGANVYEWDGNETFTLVGTVTATAKLRGHWRSHNWTLDDLVLITDLELAETVKKWDGTTFSSVSFTKGPSGEAFGNFYAKYLSVANELALFANIREPNGLFPHMAVGSERGDYTQISVIDRPSSSISVVDPFFLLTPDLKPINGLEEAFATVILSSERGRLFRLEGASAKDYSFSDFYPGSAASGREAVAYVGNDIIYGRQGRIESLRGTDRFGDSEADDITAFIAPDIESYTGWRIVYNSRLNRVYLFPEGISECWVFNTAMLGGEFSPWMRWRTGHSLAFQPTFVMSMLDPSDGLEYTMMGDSSGNIYRLEGAGLGDGGSVPISLEFLTKLHSAPLDAAAGPIEGYIKYHKDQAVSAVLRFEFAGETAFNETVTVSIPALSNIPHFGGDHWFGGDTYFGVPFENRLIRQKFSPPGRASDFQVRVQIESTARYRINEIGLRFKGAS